MNARSQMYFVVLTIRANVIPEGFAIPRFDGFLDPIEQRFAGLHGEVNVDLPFTAMCIIPPATQRFEYLQVHAPILKYTGMASADSSALFHACCAVPPIVTTKPARLVQSGPGFHLP